MAEKIRNLAARTLSAFALHWKPAEHSSRPVLSPVVPVQESVIGPDGALIWRICAGPHCVEAFSGADAWHKMRRLCREHGITLATTGVTEPAVGPPLLPDPGV
jgi:hypothetical protein